MPRSSVHQRPISPPMSRLDCDRQGVMTSESRCGCSQRHSLLHTTLVSTRESSVFAGPLVQRALTSRKTFPRGVLPTGPRMTFATHRSTESAAAAEIRINHVARGSIHLWKTCFLFDDVSGQLEGRLCSGDDLFDTISDVEGISTVSGSGSFGKRGEIVLHSGQRDARHHI